MLIVSRRPNEQIKFPNLGITVEILRVSGKTVRVGVNAPGSVRILRGELEDDTDVGSTRGENAQLADSRSGSQQATEKAAGSDVSRKGETDRERRHALRNQMNAANLALHLLQRQLDAHRTGDAEETLLGLIKTFSEMEDLAAKKSPPEATTPSVMRPRALIVEDNANERELLSGCLQMYGYEVATVGDGHAAMTYLAGHANPDVVLLDMQMPRMDGRSTISAIRGNPDYRHIKLFAVSGMDRAEMKVPLGAAGVDRWFDKPLKPVEFANQLGLELAGNCNLEYQI